MRFDAPLLEQWISVILGKTPTQSTNKEIKDALPEKEAMVAQEASLIGEREVGTDGD